MILTLFKVLVVTVALSICGMILFVSTLLGDEIRVVKKMMPILCVPPEHFETHVADTQKLWVIGIIPALPSHVMEIHRNPDNNTLTHTWTVAIRDANQKEVCILAAGNQLIPSDWFTEKHLK